MLACKPRITGGRVGGGALVRALLASAILVTVPVLAGPAHAFKAISTWSSRGGGRRRTGGRSPSLRSWRFRAVATTVLVGFLIGQPALAFELFGIKFFEPKNAETSDEVIGEPQPYTVDFQVPNGDSDTVDALKGASSWTGAMARSS